ncbi:MAG: SIR2 family protein, partial [Candidatus Hydrogenedentales bacterium]
MSDRSAYRKPPRTVAPSKIAESIRYYAGPEAARKPTVTFLLGAGFSRSAGIKTAGEIVRDYLNPHELLRDAGAPPAGVSEYAYLMGLLEPAERTRIIKECIAPAIDPTSKRTKINWAHLLLASMVDAGYVKRILTTNFDPLIVDALALTGQAVRTFDLTSSDQYISGVLEPGSVIYLHGQAWGLLMTNTFEETDVVRKHLPAVLHESLSDSMLIVVGYSGACDPVLEELAARIPVFTHRMYWVHYGSGEPEEGVREILEAYRREAYLVRDHDADAFMRALVLEGLKVELLPLVRDPLDSVLSSLRRIMPFPLKPDEVATDPIISARESVETAIHGMGRVETPSDTDFVHHYGSLAIKVAMAGATENLARLDELRPRVEAMGDEVLRRRLGDAYLQVASSKAQSGGYSEAVELLTLVEGLDFTEPEWVPLLLGNALFEQAKAKEGEEAERLFAESYEKYDAALKIKGDKHEALYNWGAALSEQAKTKEGEEADRLFAKAYEKYDAALKIKGDKHEALCNWGAALSEQAKTKEGEEAERLFAESYEKYDAALKIKGDFHEALNMWGNALSEQAKTKEGEEAERLFAEAYEKYDAALKIKGDFHEVLYNWGTALFEQARTKEGEEADRLFAESYEKYDAALKIKGDFHEALYN